MMQGMKKGSEPKGGSKSAGGKVIISDKGLLTILGIGTAAGSAIVVAADKIMKKVTSSDK